MSEEQKYVIVATSRKSGKRKMISEPMKLERAVAWKPDRIMKDLYVYFRKAKYPVNPQILK